jgi:PAS domain S-box-containing protein
MEEVIQILHLEDDAIDAELVHESLNSVGISFQITRVQTAGEFCQALGEKKYELILADYHLPGYDGLSALSFCNEKYPVSPFIFISGTMGEDAAIEGLTQGATDYVLKNKLARLIPAVKRALSETENKQKRKQAEDALRESEERYRQLVNLSPDSIAVYSQGRIVFANPSAVQMVGAKSEGDIIGRSILDFIHPNFRSVIKQAVDEVETTGKPTLFVEEKILRLDDSTIDVEVAMVPHSSRGLQYIQVVARDITERKRHELEREAIISVSQALRIANTRVEILMVLLDQLIELFEADGAIIALPNTENGGIHVEMGRGTVGEKFANMDIPPGKGISGWVIANKLPFINNHAISDPLFYRPDLLGDAHCVAAAPLIAQEQAIGVLWIARRTVINEQDLRLLNAISDIAANAIHRVTLHEQTERHLHHLIALHQIDLAISTNLDLDITLNVLLRYVKSELEADAASILILDPVTYTFDYAAGIGFKTRGIEGSHVKLGSGCAGQAAQEHRTIPCVDARQRQEMFVRSSLLMGEGFISHYATPLVVKGQVKGILETFHRKTFDAGRDWINYFETLATQAAIAVETASLFENLQRTNMELMLAYDATIEGWSRALDLRDRETEGHTQRVTEMVLELAERMGISEAERINIRRGALLHDIGKMGVPDSILNKPGDLTAEEWEIMQQHPLYAYQMLSPIDYLKQALDVPYCHHERWDGSGYPRGLKGNEIPLSARMFAVVDVFDAITSNRPYREAWSSQKALHYIKEQAGKHFDPQIVDIFHEIKG